MFDVLKDGVKIAVASAKTTFAFAQAATAGGSCVVVCGMAEKAAKDGIKAAGGDASLLAEDKNDMAMCLKECTCFARSHLYIYIYIHIRDNSISGCCGKCCCCCSCQAKKAPTTCVRCSVTRATLPSLRSLLSSHLLLSREPSSFPS